MNERIAELPPDQQALLRMHFREGKTLREIGEALGLPVGTVASRLSRILSTLRERLRIAPEDL
ncbi:MAG: sigma-70 family RNA polymerase sigma factor [Planctomycetes bacterium]|nr:sigma-70 family RNA polymerase sigma factor [Planctomycetota bacterium]